MKVKIYGTDFYYNTVLTRSDASNDHSGSGGAISATGPFLYDYVTMDHLFKIESCNFVNNQAEYRGGAVHFYERINDMEVLHPKGYFEVYLSYFYNNSASYGADVFINGHNVDLLVSEFYLSRILPRNDHYYESGAVHAYKSDVGFVNNWFEDVYFGSAAFLQDTIGFVDRTVFINCNSVYWGGGVSFSSSAMDRGKHMVSKLLDNWFEVCTATLGGGGLAIRYTYDTEPMPQVLFEFWDTLSEFYYNLADVGGAIYLEGVEVMVGGEVYIEDNGGILGGGTFVKDGMFQFTEYEGALYYSSNSATVAGGSIFDAGINAKKSSLLNCSDSFYTCSEYDSGLSYHAYSNPYNWSENDISMELSIVEEGGYGVDFAGLPNYVRTSDGKDEVSQSMEVFSGEKITFQVRIYDVFDNLVKDFPRFGDDEIVEVYFEVDDDYTDIAVLQAVNFGTELVDNPDGLVTFEGLSLSKLSSLVSTDTAVYLKVGVKLTSEDHPRSDELLLSVRIGDCPAGYQQKTTTISGKEVVECLSCPDGFYSMNENSPECFECPNNAICSSHGDRVVPNENYWAYLDDGGEVNLLFCSNGNCIGGELDSEGNYYVMNQCKGDHDPEEPLCSSCIEGFSEWNGNCIQCSNFDFMNVLVLMMFTVFIAYQLFTTHTNSQELESSIERIFSFFGQTYSFILKNVQWGALGVLLAPILNIFSNFEIPVTEATRPNVDDSSYIVDILLYPFTWVMSKIFVCPFSRSSYFILWTKLLEPFVFIMLILFLMVFTYFCCCNCLCQICVFFGKLFVDYSESRKFRVVHPIETEKEEEDSDDDESQDEKYTIGTPGEEEQQENEEDKQKMEDEEEKEEEEDSSTTTEEEEENEGGLRVTPIECFDDTDDSEMSEKELEVQSKEEEEEEQSKRLEEEEKKKKKKKKKSERDDDEFSRNSPFQWWVRIFKEEKEMRSFKGPLSQKHPVLHGCNPLIGYNCTCCYAPCLRPFIKGDDEEEEDWDREGILKKLKNMTWSCLKLDPYKKLCPKWLSIICSPVLICCGIPFFYGFAIMRWIFTTFLVSNAYRRTLVNMTIITYQMILENTMQYMLCLDVLGESRNMVYSDIKCYDSAWWAQFPFLFLFPLAYCIAYPSLIFLVLFLNRGQLYNNNDKKKEEEGEGEREGEEGEKEVQTSFQKTFGMLYLCYRKEVWWYEVASIIRKLTVVTLISFSSIDFVTTNFFLSLTLLTFLLLHIYVKPYAKPFDNWLEGIALFCLAMLQLIRTSAFFSSSPATMVVAMVLILMTFLPVYLTLLYFKYRLTLFFLFEPLEKFFVRKCLVTCCVCCFPITWCCKMYCEYCCKLDRFCCCRCFCVAPIVTVIRRKVLGIQERELREERRRLLENNEDEEEEEEIEMEENQFEENMKDSILEELSDEDKMETTDTENEQEKIMEKEEEETSSSSDEDSEKDDDENSEKDDEDEEDVN